MKTNFLSVLLSAFIIFSFQSCKKDSTSQEGNNPPEATAPVLTNIYFVDTTLTHPKDTLAKYQITYDSQGRPATIAFGEINILGDSLDASMENYFYNGNDTFVNKVIVNSRIFSGTTSTSYQNSYFYKFVNQQLVSDSGNSLGYSAHASNYTYFPTYIKKTTLGSYVIGSTTLPYSGIDNIYQTKASGNISYQLDTAIIFTPYGNNYTRLETTVSFAANPNPFYKIILPRDLAILDYSIGNFNESAAQKNLILQQTADSRSWTSPSSSTSGFTSQINYSYTYRTDGYPSEARMEATNSGNPTGYVQRAKIIFVYK